MKLLICGHANVLTNHVIMVNWKSVKLGQPALIRIVMTLIKQLNLRLNGMFWLWAFLLCYQRILMFEAHKKASPLCYCSLKVQMDVSRQFAAL